MAKLVVAGSGPGGADYVLPAVMQKAREADLLVGGERALTPFHFLNKETLAIGSDLPALVRELRSRFREQSVVVLVSGDPGFYSLLKFLRMYFAPEELEVIPGVSSVQVAFARLGVPWQDAVLLSAHGRDGRELLPGLLKPGKKAVLTDSTWTPARLAALMLEAGAPDVPVALCCRLTLPGEEILRSRLSGVTGTEGDCVMVIDYE